MVDFAELNRLLHLRPYQRDALMAIEKELVQHRGTLLVLPTGTGKTVVFAHGARRWHASTGQRVLVLAHRTELLQQAKERIETLTGLKVAVDAGEDRAVWSRLFRDELPPVVVGGVQTLVREARREVYDADTFGLVIIDEAHHALPDNSYGTVCNHFPAAKVLGVTATPDRLDRRGLGGLFQSIAYTYEIRDAIEQGYLCPIRQVQVDVPSLDLSEVRRRGGDFNEGDLERAMTQQATAAEIVGPAVKLAGDRPTIVFAVTVAHAYHLAALINGVCGSERAAAVDGTTDPYKRQQVVERYKRGELQYLVNCALFTEGFDAPATGCVLMARPTMSRALYAQMLGRGTRGGRHFPIPGKSDLLVLDFVGNSGKHALVSAFDVLQGGVPVPVRERAQRHMVRGVDMLAAIALAEAEIAEEVRKALAAAGRFTTRDVNPFTVLNVVASAGRWAGAPMSDTQLHGLMAWGVDEEEIKRLDRGQASALLDRLMQRKQQGLCTYKQARWLLRRGLNPDISFNEASALMTETKANGWRVPDLMREQYALPHREESGPVQQQPEAVAAGEKRPWRGRRWRPWHKRS